MRAMAIAPPTAAIHLKHEKRIDRHILRWHERKPGQKKAIYRSHTLPPGISRELAEQMRSEFNCSTTGTNWDNWCKLDIKYHSSNVKLATIEKLKYVYKVFTRLCHPLFLRDIDYRMLMEYRALRIESGCEPNTINTDMRVLKAAFNRAVGMGYLETNPAISKYGKSSELFSDKPEYTVRIIPLGHFVMLIEAAPTYDLKYALAIGYWTGLRPGEILRVNTYDIDLLRSILSVSNSRKQPTKSDRSREVIFPAQLVKYLEHRMQTYPKGPIVRSIGMKDGLSPSRNSKNLGEAFCRICRKAGLVDIDGKHIYTMRSLRKSCITRWIRTGLAVDEVKEMAGHRDISTTLKYYTENVIISDVKAKMDRLTAGIIEDDGIEL